MFCGVSTTESPITHFVKGRIWGFKRGVLSGKVGSGN